MTDSTKKAFWIETEKQIQTLLDNSIAMLDSTTVAAVQHYLDNGEFEIAFEGLFIELIKAKVHMTTDNKAIYFNLGKNLLLDQESVLDYTFWEKFTEYVDDQLS